VYAVEQSKIQDFVRKKRKKNTFLSVGHNKNTRQKKITQGLLGLLYTVTCSKVYN